MGNTCLNQAMQHQPTLNDHYLQIQQKKQIIVNGDQLENNSNIQPKFHKNVSLTEQKKKNSKLYRVSVIQPSQHQMTIKLKLLQQGSRVPSDFFIDYRMSDYFLTNKTITNNNQPSYNSNQKQKKFHKSIVQNNAVHHLSSGKQIDDTYDSKTNNLKKTQFRSEIRNKTHLEKYNNNGSDDQLKQKEIKYNKMMNTDIFGFPY